MDGKVFFTGRCGAGKGSKYAGRGTYCVYRLIEIICYSRGNLDLHRVKWKWNILNINNHHFYDYNHSSVLSSCFIMDILNGKNSRVSPSIFPRQCPAVLTNFAGRAGMQRCFKGWGTPLARWGRASTPPPNICHSAGGARLENSGMNVIFPVFLRSTATWRSLQGTALNLS